MSLSGEEESDMVNEISFLLEYCSFDDFVGGCKENYLGGDL